MALPSQYLVSGKSIPDVFAAIRNAKAPERFTQSFLEQLDFKSTNDRLVIGVLKALKFLDEAAKPTQRYFDFLDQTQSGRVLAEAVKEAYADLFAINVNAQNMTKGEFTGKVRTLSQGKMSDLVLDRMWLTFSALVKEADFQALSTPAEKQPADIEVKPPEVSTGAEKVDTEKVTIGGAHGGISLGGLVYNIQIHLPESRDKAVYDVLFRSLREHLL